MSRAGMTFSQILASLTTNPAQRFDSSSHSGFALQSTWMPIWWFLMVIHPAT